MKDTILIVDDEHDLRTGLERSLNAEMDAVVLTARNGNEALEILDRQPVDLVLADVRMPEMDGVELLEKITGKDPLITVIMMTAYGSIDLAVDSLKKGAYDFIQKPFDVDRVIHLINKGLERNRLLRENRKLQKELEDQASFGLLVGSSPAMREVYRVISMLAASDVTVLILGETGTGKDLAARAIHSQSSRAGTDLITVNCPALPEGLLETELFGHTRGAFTGADREKKGLFEQADGGTIFLDEIGDLSLPLQTKLLRVLQNREIRKVGSARNRTVDVRILAATNQDLEQKIKRNEFRADLYYRLNVATLSMPPLREIREDIPLLADHFLKKSAAELGKTVHGFSPDLVAFLMENDWPGNIRELENTIHGWVAMATTPMITLETLPVPAQETVLEMPSADLAIPYKDLKSRFIDTFTLDYLDRLFTHTGGNVSLSAQISGIQRQSLQKIISRYGIDMSQYRKS